MSDRQREFDFSTRKMQLQLLRELELPDAPGTSQGVMKSVLRAIDDACGEEKTKFTLPYKDTEHWDGKNTIGLCHATGFKISAVKKAVAQLKQWGLLYVTDNIFGRGQGWNSYTICWRELYAYVKLGEPLPGMCAEPAAALAGGESSAAPEPLNGPGAAVKRPQWGRSAAAYRKRPQSAPKAPPPPAPSRSDEAPAESWEEVGEELAKCGMTQAQTAIGTAKEHGLEPADVLALVSYFRSQPDAWAVGALHMRICEGVPGQPVESGWPPRRAAASKRSKPPAQPAGPPLEQLERQYGAALNEVLNKLDGVNRRELVESILDDGSSGRGPLVRQFRRNHQRDPPDRWPPSIREPVLRWMAKPPPGQAAQN